MQFRMLGPLEVVDGDHVVAVGGGRERAVLAVLLLHANAVVPSERLIEELWGEAAPATVSKNLQTYVWRLRRALPDDGVLVTRAGGYMLRLEAGRCEYDVARFERLVGEGRRALGVGEPERAARTLCEALELWRGPPFVDFGYEAFAQAEIARLEELRLAALEERVAADLALGRHAGLVAELEALVAAHPLRERLRALLMLALYRCGRQSEALEAYRQGRRRLVEELGLEPSPQLQQLEQAILRQSPDLAAPAPSVRGRGLPVAPNRTVGREHELATLVERLRTRSVRLLTLTGPGGVGKTRLALETAHAVAADFSDGAHFVSLAAVQRPEDVSAEIVKAVAIVVLAGESPEQAAERFLAAKRLLLVADNFEHVLAAAPFIGRLLSTCPALTVLATSREPLALQAEQRHAVHALGAGDAAALFCERARAHDPEFDLTDGNAHAVAQICRRVDGLPLGIELAAARCGLLSPSEIAERLPTALGTLGSGSRDTPARHMTLRATIDWSHDLLNSDEQACLAHFAVFAGGATIEAMEAITGAEMADLDRLVTKSLIVRREVRGRTRLQMLETIREYAAERLASVADRESVRERHYRYFLEFAGRHANERAVCGSGRLEHLAALDDELDNVHAALAWAAANEDAVLLPELAAAFAWYWMMRDRFADGLNWIEMALDKPGAARHPSLCISLLRHKAWALWPLGRGAERRAVMADAQRSAERLADLAVLSGVLAERAVQESWVGDLDAASTFADMAESRAMASGDRWATAIAAWAKALAGHSTAQLRERVAHAAKLLEEAGNVYHFADMYSTAGHRALLNGSDQQALEFYAAAVPLIRELGSPYEWMLLHGNLGTAALLHGDAESAGRAFSEQLHLCRELVIEPAAAQALRGFAAIAAVHDDLDRAARLCGAAAARRVLTPDDAIDARVDATFFGPARTRHGADAWDAAVQRGGTLDLRDAIDYALHRSPA